MSVVPVGVVMHAVGIDVGGTKCHGVVIDSSGVVLRRVRHSTPPADELVDLLVSMVDELRGVAGLDESMPHVSSLTPVGVGVPGLVTFDGTVRASPNMPTAHDTAVGIDLRARISNPVHVENDATLAAYGEWMAGAARGARDALMVTLGTGIGGGIVSGGTLQRGAHGFAGEIGHMVIQRDGLACGCGGKGCWERYASGSALATLSGGRSGHEVMRAANDGDADALRVIDEFAQWIALGLANLANAIDPEVIVIGGGVVESFDLVLPRVRSHFVDWLYSSSMRPHPRIDTALLGEEAGAIGAALYALHGQ